MVKYMFMRFKMFVRDPFERNKRSLWDYKRVVVLASLAVDGKDLNVGRRCDRVVRKNRV